MRVIKSVIWLSLVVILFLTVLISAALSDWKVIYTAKDAIKPGDALGYKPFKLYKDVEYGFVVKSVSGNLDFDVFLFNPGDRSIAKGVKQEDSSLVLFKPELTEEGYKIVVKNKKGEGSIRLTLAHK